MIVLKRNVIGFPRKPVVNAILKFSKVGSVSEWHNFFYKLNKPVIVSSMLIIFNVTQCKIIGERSIFFVNVNPNGKRISLDLIPSQIYVQRIYHFRIFHWNASKILLYCSLFGFVLPRNNSIGIFGAV